MKHFGRAVLPLKDGIALVGSDAHYWPGKPSTAHRAFVKFIKTMRPDIIIQNGDVIDGSTISRHPPIGWEDFPTVQEEIEVAQERLAEIEDVAPVASQKVWTLGNHDARYETRLASVAYQYKGVHGTHLKDHFPAWQPAWAVEVGGRHGAIVSHRFKGGANAAANNALWSGRSIVTGHLHRLGFTAVSDYNGTRWGIESGMLSETWGQQFKGYTEDNPLNWQSGFVVLTFRNGRMMQPELVHVVKAGLVEYQARLIKV